MGIYIWDDGSKYEGMFKQDCFNGMGELKWANGSWYKGELQNNYLHG